MGLVAAWVRALDRYQRRHRWLGFPIAVAYKYFDDHGPYLAAILTYYAFTAIFPLLLISSSVLGFFLQDDPDLRDRLLTSAFSQFPIVGDQLGQPEGLRGSTMAIVIGSVVALYGATGLGQAAQHAANVVWAVPRNSRTNPFVQRFRSLVILAFAGLGVLLVAITSLLLANPVVVGLSGGGWTVLSKVASVLVTLPILAGMYRLVGARAVSARTVLPGALFVALMWQVLQVGGSRYVSGVVTKATTSQMNQTFALVLGLVAFLFAIAAITVIGHEINVIAHDRLYPRALLTPFTDNVSLTDADRRAYTGYAKSQQHKGFQSIETTFDRPPANRRSEPDPPSSDQ